FIFSKPFSSPTMIDTLASKSGIKVDKIPPIPPNRIILQDSSSPESIDYETLRRDSLRLANGIRGRFGKPLIANHFGSRSSAGPVVLIHLPNCVSWPVIALGFFAAGWTVTGSNPHSTVSELAHIIKLCEPRVIICRPAGDGADNIRKACIAAEHKKVDIFLAVPSSSSDDRWTTLLSDHELEIEPFVQANTRLALILWTSGKHRFSHCNHFAAFNVVTLAGTTGKSKGAMITHRAIIACLVLLYMYNSGYSAEEQWIGVPPFYHIFGLYALALMGMSCAAEQIHPSQFDLVDYLRLVTKHKATILFLAPPVAVALAKYGLPNNPSLSLKSARFAVIGGAPLSPAIVRQLWECVGLLAKQGYGMTEVGSISGFRTNTWKEIEPKLNSCGIPSFLVQVKIIGMDGESVGKNRPGEIVISSPAQMLGYLKNPNATAETIYPDGVHTGDIGYMDDDGYITRRFKELIKVLLTFIPYSFQVSPSEIEAVISSLSDVQEAAVSSVYSETQGTELPIAYIVPRNSAMLNTTHSITTELAALADAVKSVVEKNLIHYKRLRGGITFVSVIPKTSSGKFLRPALKDLQGMHVECYTKGALSKL
ncbi:hypothetical protein BU17DRAFT_43688, partial [Hysterangium stoloniferum]